MDLFDPKPKLNELDGQKLPESMVKEVRFAFIQKDSAVLMGTPRNFGVGQCGMELSELLPHISSCADDIALIRSMHQSVQSSSGSVDVELRRAHVRPAEHGFMAHLRFGQRIANLPGYVVLTVARHQWRLIALVERIPAVELSRRAVPKPGRPVLNLSNPPGHHR